MKHGGFQNPTFGDPVRSYFVNIAVSVAFWEFLCVHPSENFRNAEVFSTLQLEGHDSDTMRALKSQAGAK